MYHIEEAAQGWAVVHSMSGERVLFRTYHAALETLLDLQLSFQRCARMSDVEVRCAR